MPESQSEFMLQLVLGGFPAAAPTMHKWGAGWHTPDTPSALTDGWRHCTCRNRNQSLCCSSCSEAFPRQRLPCTNGLLDGTPRIGNQSSPDSLPRRDRCRRVSACNLHWGRCTAQRCRRNLHHSSCWAAVPQQRLSCTNGSLGGTPPTCNPSLYCTLRPHCRPPVPALSCCRWLRHL